MTTENANQEKDPRLKSKEEENRNCPPKTPLVLRIGVTGHRPDPKDTPEADQRRALPDEKTIRAIAKEVLEVIRIAFKGVAETSDSIFNLRPTEKSQPTGGVLRLISGLATGPDQWVAEEAVELGFELQSILPFSREEFQNDFQDTKDIAEYKKLLKKSSAVLELDGKVACKEEPDDADAGKAPGKIPEPGEGKKRIVDAQSYVAVGNALINQTDLLIAIWDGKPAKGPGGTGYVVNSALNYGIPVVWIPWIGVEGYKLHGPTWHLIRNPQDVKGDQDRLTAMVQELLLPPEETQYGNFLGRNLRTSYFNENQKHGNPQLGMWKLFRNIVCGNFIKWKNPLKFLGHYRVSKFVPLNYKEKEVAFWTRKYEGGPLVHPVDKEVQSWLIDKYSEHYSWANGLSMYYGELHRSSFLLNYLLGALAVFLALVCITKGVGGKTETGWILGELLVIVGILGLTYQGGRRRWHQRWIDYRTLAERLRVARCMALFGGGTTQLSYEGNMASYGNPTNTWMNWHYRAIERAAGLPDVRITDEYLASCQEFWRDVLIESQLDYHRRTYKLFKMMDKRLHWLGDSLFIATFFACVVHLADIWLYGDPRFDWIPETTGGLMTMLCAFLPALGAAFAAIRSHGELQRLAQRSRAMDETLDKMKLELATLRIAGDALNSLKLRGQVDRVSDLMAKEMLDWRVVFQNRTLSLPT